MNTGKNELEITEVKIIQIQILDYINNLFTKNQISFWLDSGTLLGSVRHQGYIPWDDDIDIVILRKDYDRAIELINSQGTKYKALTMNNTNGYYYLFAKITDTNTHIIEKNLAEIKELGIYIDMFPLDYLPGNEKDYKKLVNKIFRLRSAIYYGLLEGEVLKHSKVITRVKHYMGKLYGIEKALRKVDRICRTSSKNNNVYIANIVGASNKERKIPVSTFEETIYSDFEGKKYPIPKGYDTYLTTVYGDYMTLPPESERVATHGFKAYKTNG